jgi:hypothetical protein
MFTLLETTSFSEHEYAMVWLDFGPNTIAENQAQAEVLIEHLLRRRIPTILISQYYQAESYLRTIPSDIAVRLEREFPGERWHYGDAWINAGYKPDAKQFIQALTKAPNVSEFLAKDVNGSKFTNFPRYSGIRGIEQIKLVGEVTGLTGVFDNIIQFFQKEKYRPLVVHGCTSITVPEAYIFLDSGQLSGLLEGLAGAAWYSYLMKEQHPQRAPDTSLVRYTALHVGQIAILLLIIAGNLVMCFDRYRRSHA